MRAVHPLNRSVPLCVHPSVLLRTPVHLCLYHMRVTDCLEHRLHLCACLCVGSSCSFIPVCLCGLFHISGIRRLFPHVVCLRVFCLPICLCFLGLHVCVLVCMARNMSALVSMCMSVHIEMCKDVCVCVRAVVWKAAGSPPGPHLLRPDQTKRRGARSAAALLWSSSLRSGTWPRAASK